jgi:hypothetical protein
MKQVWDGSSIAQKGIPTKMGPIVENARHIHKKGEIQYADMRKCNQRR